MSLHEYAKECLAESLVELMEQKTFHSISITELTKKSRFFENDVLSKLWNERSDFVRATSRENESDPRFFFRQKKETRVSDFLILFFKTFRAEKKTDSVADSSKLNPFIA